MKTLHFSLFCRFWVLWQSSDFCLAFCTQSHDSHCIYRCSEDTEHVVKSDLRKGIGHFNLFSLYSTTWDFWREVFISRIAIFSLDWIKRNIFQVTGQSPGWETLTVSFFFPFFHGKEHSSSSVGKLLPTSPCGSWGGEAKPIYIRLECRTVAQRQLHHC